MKPDPKVFLDAAKWLFQGHDVVVPVRYACNALRLVRSRRDNAVELRYFHERFLIGTDIFGRDSLGYIFGSTNNPACQEHRVMSLLLCWAMTSNP
jgi:hypothetical protein